MSYDVTDAMVECVYAAFASDETVDTQTIERELDQVRAGVIAAVASNSVPTVRVLFDACLLAGATDSQLAAAFAVSPYEARAYRHLFFDRNVFPNAFHVVHYIATRQTEHEQELLRIAQSQGFAAIATQYGLPHTVTPESALENVLAADVAIYRRHRELPLTHPAIKDIRALGKQVVETAKAVQKVQESRVAAAERKRTRTDDEDVFELIPGPANPTLEELLAAGGELATPAEKPL